MPFLLHVHNALSATGLSPKIAYDSKPDGKPFLDEADRRAGVVSYVPLGDGEASGVTLTRLASDLPSDCARAVRCAR